MRNVGNPIFVLLKNTVFISIIKSMISLRDQVQWVIRCFPNPAPSAIKRRIIGRYFKRYQFNCFIETGTYTGDTLAKLAKRARHCVSIELSSEYAERAKQRFVENSNVKILEGDSAVLISQVLDTLEEPALFWLDGHYSGGITAGVNKHTPISEELNAILSHDVNEHVILIDDARCFDGTNDYPKLEDLLAEIRINGQYDFEVSMDIIRLTPKQS